MAGDPGIVGADGNRHDVDRSLEPKTLEVCPGRVAGQADPASFARKDIPIEPAMHVVSNAGSPVLHPEGRDRQRPMPCVEPTRLAPAHLDHATESERYEKIRGRCCGDHRDIAWQSSKRGEIHVIHVCVRQQHEIERGQLSYAERRRNIPLRTERQGSDSHTDPHPQGRIHERHDPEEVEQYRRMPEPGHRDPIVPPCRRIWLERRRRNGSEVAVTDPAQPSKVPPRQRPSGSRSTSHLSDDDRSRLPGQTRCPGHQTPPSDRLVSGRNRWQTRI